MARLQTLKLPKGVEIDEVSNDNLFTHPSAGSVPTTLAVKDYLRDEIDKHDQEFMPDGLYRNAIINGNFDIWQRGTSFTNPSAATYLADRWKAYLYDLTDCIVTRQEFAAGQTDVPNNPAYFMRLAISAPGANYRAICQRIEDVRSFAGQTVAISAWIRTDPPVAIQMAINKNFGSGGSATVLGSWVVVGTASTSWQRLTYSVSMPSISGKTIGAGSFIELLIVIPKKDYIGNVDIAQVQLNIGDKPLPFAPRPIAEELALCQRYYENSFDAGITPSNGNAAISTRYSSIAISSGDLRVQQIQFKVRKRVPPTITYYGYDTANWQYYDDASTWTTVAGMNAVMVNETSLSPQATISGTAGNPYLARGGWAADAEL